MRAAPRAFPYAWKIHRYFPHWRVFQVRRRSHMAKYLPQSQRRECHVTVEHLKQKVLILGHNRRRSGWWGVNDSRDIEDVNVIAEHFRPGKHSALKLPVAHKQRVGHKARPSSLTQAQLPQHILAALSIAVF